MLQCCFLVKRMYCYNLESFCLRLAAFKNLHVWIRLPAVKRKQICFPKVDKNLRQQGFFSDPVEQAEQNKVKGAKLFGR